MTLNIEGKHQPQGELPQEYFTYQYYPQGPVFAVSCREDLPEDVLNVRFVPPGTVLREFPENNLKWVHQLPEDPDHIVSSYGGIPFVKEPIDPEKPIVHLDI